ncbi:unnamed protein product [Lactuca saligna]|uniref:Uncharacterized protein n=1 Tax=Lactuca saligna TaxID=75948 RepID=A0AA35VR47_LACSI|nr:unnamed protein product [Lactuca saligna]
MDPELIDFVDWQKVAEKMAFLRPVEVKLVPVSLEGIAFRTKVLNTDELMNYTSLIATISQILVVVFPHGCTQNYQAISLGFDSSRYSYSESWGNFTAHLWFEGAQKGNHGST